MMLQNFRNISILRFNSKNQNQYLRFFANSLSEEKCPARESNARNEKVSVTWENALPMSKIPSPSVYPFIGMTHHFLPGGKYYNLSMVDMHLKMRKEYGDILFFKGNFGKPDMVFTYDPDSIEKVYRTEGQWPDRQSLESFAYFRKNLRPDIFSKSGGLLAEQGEEWHNLRMKVNPVMLQPKTVRAYVKPVDDVAIDLIERIKLLRDNKNEVPADFGNEMNKWSLESIGYIALNARLGVLGELDKDSDGQKFIQCVHDFFQLTFELDVMPSIWKYYKTRKFVKLMVTLETLTNLTMKYIDTAIEQMKTDNNPNRELSVLEKLLKIDRYVAVVMALDMLMAGVDTTSATVITLLNLLAKNPEKQEILRKEILEKLPNKNSELKPEILNNMPYLRACLKESARIMPVAGGNIRATGQDLVLQGYQIPKNTWVVMSHITIQNDEKYFPRSSEFLPERWLKKQGGNDENISNVNVHPFVYMPFGFGSRSCVGRRLAELEIEILIIRILRNFKVEWHYDDIKYVGKMLNTPGGDLKFRFNDLKD